MYYIQDAKFGSLNAISCSLEDDDPTFRCYTWKADRYPATIFSDLIDHFTASRHEVPMVLRIDMDFNFDCIRLSETTEQQVFFISSGSFFTLKCFTECIIKYSGLTFEILALACY